MSKSVADVCDPIDLRKTRLCRLTGENRSPWLSIISAWPRNSTPCGAQSEMQAVQDVSLGVAVHVHQRVAACQQVDAGDRGVLDQVVATEDDGAPERPC